MAESIVQKKAELEIDFNEYVETLPATQGRANGQSSQKSQRTLSPGLYALISSTSANNYSGRSFAYFSGDGVTQYDMMPPTLTTQFDYRSMTQFVNVPAGTTKTISLMYWDTNATGARHDWVIVRLVAYH